LQLILADDDAAWSISRRFTESIFSNSRVKEEDDEFDEEDELEETIVEEEDESEAVAEAGKRNVSDSSTISTEFSSLLAEDTNRKASNFPSLFIFIAATLATRII
tara:strand:- start:332 stop:646 length:315 start_codon:yes stop_codon:yes gene_type:complete